MAGLPFLRHCPEIVVNVSAVMLHLKEPGPKRDARGVLNPPKKCSVKLQFLIILP